VSEEGGPADRRTALRLATLRLVVCVVLLDAVALALYYFAGIEHGSTQTKQIFTAVWMVATAVTVAVLLKRVRAIRYNR
jgi:uncharacterized membrane protein YeiH